MWRYLAGAASALVLIMAGFFLVRSMAGQEVLPPVPETTVEAEKADITELANPMRFAGSTKPPSATELSKEEKRFNRYDKDKNGAVAKAEYLASRQKAYTKLDVNGDGVLSFDEYAVKTVKKFAAADRDKTGSLNRSEFSTTRVVRKLRPKLNCPPAAAQQATSDKSEADESAES